MVRLLRWTIALVAALALAGTAYLTREQWLPLLARSKEAAKKEEDHHAHSNPNRVKLTPQARRNLKLQVKSVELKPVHWRTMLVPGAVVDRPGQSDRGVTAPIAGVVTKINTFPSDTVRPGEALFTLRLVSELVENAQAELHKATKEREVNALQLKRLEAGAESGSIAEARLIEARGQQTKVDAKVRSYRQVLQSRGLTPAQIAKAAAGEFVRQVEVVAPPPLGAGQLTLANTSPPGGASTAYEVQDLKTQLGDQVQPGQVLATLANHRLLYIEGRGFKSESSVLSRAAEKGWPVEAEVPEDDPSAWGPLKQTLTIRHLANAVDTSSRTFGFYVPLVNQSRTYSSDGKTFLVWRFRPGQRVRLHVPVEPFKDAIVLPPAAVTRDGPEAYVFRANGDAFDRQPVTILYENRSAVVLASDGSVSPGEFVAMNGAAALNRVLRAQQSAGEGGHEGHGHSH